MLTLDLQCPVVWKSSHASGGSSILASPTPLSKQAPLLSDNLQDSTNACYDYDEEWLQRRYCETLWLGEDHSPLVGFLHHLRRFERRRRCDSPLQLITLLANLLKSRQQIRKRFTSATSAGFGEGSLERVISALCRKEDGDQLVVDVKERQVVQIALESGPGYLVREELRKSDMEKVGKMTKLWMQAMESRELQIQILLVLNLLRLSTRVPAMSSTSMTKSNSNQTDVKPDGDQEQEQKRIPLGATRPDIHGQSASATRTTPITKRKRKSDNARRWTGGKGMAAFPWTLQRQTSREDNVSNKDDKDEKSTSPESLSKRFGSLLDSLCLQVLTGNLTLDVERIPTDQSPPISKTTEVKNRVQPWQLFGSEGRRRQKSKGDKDVLQWLCCHIIEPQFSKTLPRQCGIVRGKCFIPGSGSTPAKPARKESIPLQRPLSSKNINVIRQSTREQEDLEEERRRRRFISRAKSQSPAPMPWSLLREEEEENRKLQPLNSSLIGKWDARTVTVRKKWDRSQSIGPITTSEIAPTVEHRSSLQPAVITDISLSNLERKKSTIEKRDSKAGILNRSESQTFVIDTPQKGQSFGDFPRSSSFSAQSQSHTLKMSTSTAAASLASWRRTESQPVLSLGMKRKLGDDIEWSSDDEDN